MSIFDDTLQAGDEDVNGKLPSYMLAADNHNIGNLNSSYEDGAPKAPLSTRIYNMVGSAAVSGINSFYNTAV